MPKRKVASNASLGSQLIKTKKKQPYKVGEGPEGRGFKVVGDFRNFNSY